MGLIPYDVASREICGFMNLCSETIGIPFLHNDKTTNGRYFRYIYQHDDGEFIAVGTQKLYESRKSEGLSDVDFVSIHKQAFHEMQHYLDYESFYKPSDDPIVKRMAHCAFISDIFPNYYFGNNYWRMPHEINAEMNAIIAVRDYMNKRNFPFIHNVDTCIIEGVNHRKPWVGTQPVVSVDSAIADLKARLQMPCHFVLQPVDDMNRYRHPPEDEDPKSYKLFCLFMDSKLARTKYDRLDDSKKDQFLIDYICKHDEYLSRRYKSISDEFPDLSIVGQTLRESRRIIHGLRDENEFDTTSKLSRGELAEQKFSDVFEQMSDGISDDFSY